MLTLLINETKPLAGLFASTTGGIGSVPDISVADDGQAVSVQTFTRTAGVITDSFTAGDVLHIGIGDGVNAPVCYIALASASPATGTMAINTDGMVALFAATSANQLSLQVGVVRTRGGNTNTIFSAPIVIHRSVINIATAVPTPSILGTGVAAALQVAINTALGFVRLDASARLPAVDGSQLTNVPNELPSQTGNSGKYLTTNGTATSWGTVSTGLTVGTTAIASGTTGRILYDNAGVLGELPVGTGVATALAVNVGSAGAFLTSAVTSITGTANEITVTGTTTPTLSLPSALTFTGKTVTGGTFTGGEFNGTLGATTPSTVAGTTGTFSGELSTTGASSIIYTNGASAHIYTNGLSAAIFANGTNGYIATLGTNGYIATFGTGGYIQTRSTFKLNAGTFTTTLSHAPTADRAIAFPDAAGTLALVSGNLGTPTLVGTNITGTAASLTAGNVTTNANLTGHVTSVGNAAVLGSFTMAQLSAAVSDGDPAYVGAANTFTTGQTISATTSLLLGTAGSAVGNVGFKNATSGTTTLAPATGALGTGTVTLPLSGTLATLDGSETLTNKSIVATQLTGTIADARNTVSNSTTTTMANLTTVGALGAGTFTTIWKSTTAFATPGALSATEVNLYASTVSGGSLGGFGTTNDVTLRNRAGTVCLGVGPNTTTVNIPGTLTVGSTINSGGFIQFQGGGGADVCVTGGSKFRVGTQTSAVANMESQSTGEQLRLQYSSTQFASFTVGSTGTLTLGGTGTNNGLAVSGTLAVIGATTLTAALITTPEALAPALNAGAACGVTTVASGFALNGVNALTLANGTNGQIKTIVCTAVTAAGTATLTPTTCTGYTTVAFTAAGQTLTLQYFTTGGWHILSVRGAVPA